MLPTIIILRNNVETGKILGTSEKTLEQQLFDILFYEICKNKNQ